MKPLALIFAVLLASCDGDIASESFRLSTSNQVFAWDTNGQSDRNLWTKIVSESHVLSGVRNVVVENDMTSVAYTSDSAEQQGAHKWYLNDGGIQKLVNDKYYGDYVYWTASQTTPPTSARVEELSQDRVITEHDLTINGISFTKRVLVRACDAGYFVGFDSVPLKPCCEREIGFGKISNISYGEHGLFQFPKYPTFGEMQSKASPGASWTAAYSNDGILRTMIVARPMNVRAMKFSPEQLGIHIVNLVENEVGDEFQVYMVADKYTHKIRYDAAGLYYPGWSKEIPITSAEGEHDLWISYSLPYQRASTVSAKVGSYEIRGATVATTGTVTTKVGRIYLRGGSQVVVLSALDQYLSITDLFVTPVWLHERHLVNSFVPGTTQAQPSLCK
jgi:hypothetical protein